MERRRDEERSSDISKGDAIKEDRSNGWLGRDEKERRGRVKIVIVDYVVNSVHSRRQHCFTSD